MKLPKQVKPVIRPDVVKPDTVLNFSNATERQQGHLAYDLTNGANYNDPMKFSIPVAFCGCHLLFGTSRATCTALCLS
jgi:cyanobactin biosynthesis protein (PatB/AcyB/McaB family)